MLYPTELRALRVCALSAIDWCTPESILRFRRHHREGQWQCRDALFSQIDDFILRCCTVNWFFLRIAIVDITRAIGKFIADPF